MREELGVGVPVFLWCGVVCGVVFLLKQLDPLPDSLSSLPPSFIPYLSPSHYPSLATPSLFRPDDVVTAVTGDTIEVVHSDAEVRELNTRHCRGNGVEFCLH
jgi:hypothetical protein